MKRQMAATIVQQSWRQMGCRQDGLGGLFYASLFGANPHLRPLFPSSLEEQERKFKETLAFVVQSADAVDDKVARELNALGRRHKAYGARPEHYPIVCHVLIAVLAKSLGTDWTEEAARAWQAVLDRVCAEMLKETESGTD